MMSQRFRNVPLCRNNRPILWVTSVQTFCPQKYKGHNTALLIISLVLSHFMHAVYVVSGVSFVSFKNVKFFYSKVPPLNCCPARSLSVLACSAVGCFKAYDSPTFSVSRAHYYYVPEDTFDNSTEIMRVEAPVKHQYSNGFEKPCVLCNIGGMLYICILSPHVN